MPSSQQPSLSVVIPTHDRAVSLARALQALSQQALPASEFEVIVVQDGECTETRQLLESGNWPFRLRLLQQEHKGAPAARNRGAATAEAEILVFIDDDIALQPNVLSDYLRIHREQEDVAVFGSFLPDDASLHPLVQDVADLSRTHFARCSTPGRAVEIGDFPNGNMSVRKAHVLAAGGWDEAFTGVGGEDDADLASRLIAQGLRLRFVPEALGQHLWVKSWGRLLRDKENIGRVHVHLAAKLPQMISKMPFTQFAAGPRSRRLPLRVARYIPQPFLKLLRSIVESCFEAGSPRRFPRLFRALIRISASLVYLKAFWQADPSLAKKIAREAAKRVPVLGFHHVTTDPEEESDLAMLAPRFEREVKILRLLGYKTVTPAQLLSWQQELAPLPKKPVLLTFDDGYHGFREIVAPILQRRGFTATIFLLTGRLGATVTWNGYRPMQIMDSEEAKSLFQHGFELQAHTATHPDLTTLPPSSLVKELKDSAETIRTLTGRQAQFFAYPHGRYNAAVVSAVADSGYKGAFTCNGLRNRISDPPLLWNRAMLPTRPEWWRLWRELTR